MIDFDKINETVISNFYGGDGETVARMFIDGERMTKLYLCAVLNTTPNFESEEEENFYNKVKKEIEENPDAQWTIPSE